MPLLGRSRILLFNAWAQLTTVLNELARSMGHYDFYPFVMCRPVLKKIHFIQMAVKETREKEAAARIDPPALRAKVSESHHRSTPSNRGQLTVVIQFFPL